MGHSGTREVPKRDSHLLPRRSRRHYSIRCDLAPLPGRRSNLGLGLEAVCPEEYSGGSRRQQVRPVRSRRGEHRGGEAVLE